MEDLDVSLEIEKFKCNCISLRTEIEVVMQYIKEFQEGNISKECFCDEVSDMLRYCLYVVSKQDSVGALLDYLEKRVEKLED